jgi:hypothetical protein
MVRLKADTTYKGNKSYRLRLDGQTPS